MIDGSWYKRPEGVSESTSAGGVVVRKADGQVLVALVQEQSYDDYVLPKGRVDNGEDLEAAARREVEEEAGFTKMALIEPLGVKERLSFDRSEWKRTHYFLFATEEVDATPADTEHHQVMAWFPIDRLPELMWPEQQALLEENRARIVKLVDGTVRRDR